MLNSQWLISLILIGFNIITMLLVNYKKIREQYLEIVDSREARNEKRKASVIIGVVGCQHPSTLVGDNVVVLPGSFNDTVRRKYAHNHVIVVRCRSLSYALIHCDWVLTNIRRLDSKIIDVNDVETLNAIINRFKEDLHEQV